MCWLIGGIYDFVLITGEIYKKENAKNTKHFSTTESNCDS